MVMPMSVDGGANPVNLLQAQWQQAVPPIPVPVTPLQHAAPPPEPSKPAGDETAKLTQLVQEMQRQLLPDPERSTTMAPQSSATPAASLPVCAAPPDDRPPPADPLEAALRQMEDMFDAPRCQALRPFAEPRPG